MKVYLTQAVLNYSEILTELNNISASESTVQTLIYDESLK